MSVDDYYDLIYDEIVYGYLATRTWSRFLALRSGRIDPGNDGVMHFVRQEHTAY